MKIKKIVRMIAVFLTAIVVTATAAESVAAYDLPYITYNYDYWEDIVYTPAAYVPAGNIYATQLTYNGEPIGAFANPQDMCRSENGKVYIADTNNNRIVVLDSSLKNVIRVITTFDNEGSEDTFSSPTGVAVSEENKLYVADSVNHRILVFGEEDKVVQTIDNPQSEVLEDGYIFTPLKVTVDYANRVYCVAQNMFEGIMVFESNGEFTGFFGTISVNLNLWEKFWRKVSTKEERAKQQLYIPTEFTGMDIDPEGFVYASSIDPNGVQGIRRLNPKGEDVIEKGANNNVGGDLQIDGTTEYAGVSQFTDVVYRGNGIYTCLDRKRGRLFTYDHEGNLLYIFGGMGTQVGTFDTPVAVEQLGDKMAVLDAATGGITLFDVTEYGDLINKAVALRFDGDEAQAVPLWQKVLELDENNELANTGIGKSYLTAGDYENAMKYLEIGRARTYYSTAFKRYRNNILTANAPVILTLVVVVVVGLIVFFNLMSKRKKKKGEI